MLAALACGGHVLFEDVPGTAKTVLARAIAGSDRGRASLAHPVHARPAADATSPASSVYNQQTREFEFRPGPGLRERRARRRDQPRDAEDAVGAARGDGRAAGHGRRRHAPAADAVPRASRPRTRSSRRAPSRCPRRSSTASSCSTALGYPDEDEELADRRDQRHGHPLDALRARRHRRGGARSCRRAVEDVYVDELLERWIVELVRATRAGRRRRRSAPPSAAASRSSARRAPGRSCTAATTSTPRTSSGCSCPCSATGCCLTPAFLAETRGAPRDERSAIVRDRCLELAPPPAPDWDGKPRPVAAPRPSEPASERRPSRSSRAGGSTGLPFGEQPSRPPRPRLRRRRLAPVRARRPDRDDRLVRVGPPLVGARAATSSSSASTSPTRRRASSSSRDRRPSMALYDAVAAVALEAGSRCRRRRRDRGQRARRARRDRLRRRGRGPRPSLLAAAACGARPLGDRGSRPGGRLGRAARHARARVRPPAPRPRRAAAGELRVRRLRLPRRAARGRPRSGRPPCAGTSSRWWSRTRSGSRASPSCRRSSSRSRTRRRAAWSRRGCAAARRRERRLAHERRLRDLLDDLVRMGLEPVVIGTSDPVEIDRELLAWSDRRRRAGRRRR